MKNRLEIQNRLEQRKNRNGLVGTRLEVNEIEGNNFSAYINLDFSNIVLNYGKDLDLLPDRETKSFAKKRNIENPEEKIGEDILDHEAGHREKPTETKYGCPYNLKLHDSIKESIFKGLQEKGKRGLEDYVANAFEDVLNNVNCRRETDFAGQTLFWNNQGLVNSKGNKFSPFYEAFVKLNLLLAGKPEDATLLRRFYTNDKKVQSALSNFKNLMSQRLNTSTLLRMHKQKAFNTLFDYNLEQREALWSDLAYNFATTMADLLDSLPKEEMFAEEENFFDKEMKQPLKRQEIAYSRYQAGEGLATHRDVQEQLYDLYKKISKEISIETSQYQSSSLMPLVHFGKRFIKEDKQTSRIRGIGIKEDGSIGLRTHKHSLDLPINYKTHPRNFPRLKIALMDRSGSMTQSPDGGSEGDTSYIPWGDNSKYHYALKGYFGIDNFFDNQKILDYVENVALGFSGEGVKRGNAKEVAKSLLTSPSGGTSLDINGLEREITEGSFTISISDGGFSFSEEDKKRLKDKITDSDYAHIQIGGSTPYSTWIESIGKPVVYVRGDDDLSRAMVSFVSGFYKQTPTQH